MKKIYFLTSIVLMIVWAICFFFLNVSPVIHALPWLAIVLSIHAVLMCDKPTVADRAKESAA